MKEFEGKVVIIIGVVLGIGKVIVVLLVKKGVKVILVDFFVEKGDLIVEDIKVGGGEVCFIVCDVVELVSVNSMIESCLEEYG